MSLRTALVKTLTQCWILVALAGFGVAASIPGFKVTKKYPIPGDGGFDYILFDSSSNRLYVSHGTQVDVLDADSGKLLGKVEGTPGVHGIAIVPDLHRGFTTNGGNSTVSIFDSNTFKITKTIAVAKAPDFIFYDPATKRVLVCHEDGEAITALDPAKEVIIKKMELGTEAEAAVLDGKGTGFVNLEKANMIATFDSERLSVKQKWPIAGCKGPTPLGMDTLSARLFVGCRESKTLAVLDADSGKVIAMLPIGDTVDGIIYDPDNKLIFASNGDGTVSVIRQKSANEYESAGYIQTQPSAKTMAFDPKTKRLFLSAVEIESVSAANGRRARTRPKPGTLSVLVVDRQ